MSFIIAHIAQREEEETYITKKVRIIGHTWKKKWKNTIDLKKKDIKRLTIKTERNIIIV